MLITVGKAVTLHWKSLTHYFNTLIKLNIMFKIMFHLIGCREAEHHFYNYSANDA